MKLIINTEPKEKKEIKSEGETALAEKLKQYNFPERHGIDQMWFDSLVRRAVTSDNDNLFRLFIESQHKTETKVYGAELETRLLKTKFLKKEHKLCLTHDSCQDL